MVRPKPNALVIIKPLTIGRKDGPEILGDILDNCNVVLYKFRAWTICNTTWSALEPEGRERSSSVVTRESWICLFEGLNHHRDTSQILSDYFGPEDRNQWLPNHLRYKYSMFKTLGDTVHPDDDVVRLSDTKRIQLEMDLLF